MSNGARLHIDRKSLWEPLLDGFEFLTLCDKLIARADLSQMDCDG